MTPEAQRIAIAEACGWSKIRAAGKVMPGHYVGCYGPLRGFQSIPDYLNDLNAMADAENTLSPDQQAEFGRMLYRLSRWTNRQRNYFDVAHTPAAQRAKAFLKCKNLWRTKTG